MRSDKRILLAFLLNLGFSLFEFVGGLITGSVAILSDALHDLGDAAGIGVSLFLERKSVVLKNLQLQELSKVPERVLLRILQQMLVL